MKEKTTMKEKLTALLDLHLGEQFKYFPQYILDDKKLTYVSDYNQWWKKIQFNFVRSMKEMLNEEMDVGNEQRGQSTDQILGEKSKTKRKWDNVAYSAITGVVELGPLLSVVRGYGIGYHSDFLHRRILFEKIVNDEWIITHNPMKNLFSFFVTKNKNGEEINKVRGKKFSEWPKKWQDSFLNCQVMSVGNIFTSEDAKENEEIKSLHFIIRNDNVNEQQLIHSYSSPVNDYLKPRFGFRFTKQEKDSETGELKNVKTLDYKSIRNESPLPLLRDKNWNTKSKGRGYDEYNNRVLLSGYQDFNTPKSFSELKPYQLGVQLLYSWDKVDWNNEKHNVSKFVDLSWNSNGDLANWVNERESLTEKEINEFETDLKEFSKNYNKLQDIERVHCMIPQKERFFKYKIIDIMFAWYLFLEFKRLGKFTDYENVYTKDNPFNVNCLETEIVKLLSKLKKMDKQAPDDHEDNLFSHRRSFQQKSGQSKTMNAFFKNFLNKSFQYTDNKISVEWKLESEEYPNWKSYNFTDPKTSFEKPDQYNSFNKQSNTDYVTGHPVQPNHTDAHHIVYRTAGGISKGHNCAITHQDYNRSLFNKFDSTSQGIKHLLLESPESFTKERKKYWENGGMEELEKFEKDFNNYYWPTYVK